MADAHRRVQVPKLPLRPSSILRARSGGLVGLFAILVLAGAAHSARTPVARLTYSVTSGGLCLARPDGSRPVRLVRGSATDASWSPSGRFIAFVREGKIVIADARGRVVRRFGSTAADPAWAPDGTRLAYTDGTPVSRIVIATSRGRIIRTLQTGIASAREPAWSPSGRQLAYSELTDTDRPTQAGNGRIFVINASGSGRRLLVGLASEPAWSPDGSRLAYVEYASRFAETGHLALIGIDGSRARRPTSGSEQESDPAWSPRGRLIAFARGLGANSVVASVRPDGSGERILARSAFDPAWRRATPLPKVRRGPCP